MNVQKALCLALFSVLLGSCKDSQETTTTAIETAVLETPVIIEETREPVYGYILAPSGLKVRSTPSTKGKSLGTIPVGTKVVIMQENQGETITVGNLKGSFMNVSFDNKAGYSEGYVFAPFISSIPVPTRKMTLEQYEYLLKTEDVAVERFEKAIIESETTQAGYEEGIFLPGDVSIETAFYVADMLFNGKTKVDIPAFDGVPIRKVISPKTKSDDFVNEYQFSWDVKKKLDTIIYSKRREGYGENFTITRTDGKIKIVKAAYAD